MRTKEKELDCEIRMMMQEYIRLLETARVFVRRGRLAPNLRASLTMADGVGVITLNRTLSEEDQLIGLFHELGHLMTGGNEMNAKLISNYLKGVTDEYTYGAT